VLSDLRRAAKSGLSPPSLAAPRVTVMRTESGQGTEFAPDGTQNLDDFRASFLAAFGTTNETIAAALFQQLLNALLTEPDKPLDCTTANFALALVNSIAPKDELEAMLACQLIVAHVAAMDASRRALHIDQTAAGRAAYLSLARKLMTLFTAQMDALNRHRGKGTVQRVVVERVYVAPGGQAIVGAVAGPSTRGGGG
jgi:hypothetical protein